MHAASDHGADNGSLHARGKKQRMGASCHHDWFVRATEMEALRRGISEKPESGARSCRSHQSSRGDEQVSQPGFPP